MSKKFDKNRDIKLIKKMERNNKKWKKCEKKETLVNKKKEIFEK